MRYLALATDYDGTIARDGIVDDQTVAALKRFRQSGRKIILVTGRELPDLEKTFPHLDLFDRVVAENGAVLFDPASRAKRLLAERPSDQFIERLRSRGVDNLGVGDAIVATWHPHEGAVLETIRELGLDLQVIFNKEAVMVLPTGVNKMSGLSHALSEMKLSRHNVLGVGDAENDHAFLNCCGYAVAVSNAIPALKERVDLVTEGERGAGVVELVDRVLADEMASVAPNTGRHGVPFGQLGDRTIHINSDSQAVLLCGRSGSGKSTFVSGLVENLVARDYQTCLIDPEGDYENIGGFVTLGNEDHGPSFDEIFQLLEKPASNLVINLVGVKMKDRPGYFSSLLNKLQETKQREGRPHWLIVDEAHHLLPAEWAPASADVSGRLPSLLLVTVHPEHVSPAALRLVNILTVIGKEPHKSAEEFARVVGIETPPIPADDLPPGAPSVWFRDSNEVIEKMQCFPGSAERKRHRRKYAEGELEDERAFYFRGPSGKMNLRAQNLATFLQISEGIDQESWEYHANQGDYSNWLTTAIKDAELGEEVKRIERDKNLPLEGKRAQIAKAIEAKYTASA